MVTKPAAQFLLYSGIAFIVLAWFLLAVNSGAMAMRPEYRWNRPKGVLAQLAPIIVVFFPRIEEGAAQRRALLRVKWAARLFLAGIPMCVLGVLVEYGHW